MKATLCALAVLFVAHATTEESTDSGRMLERLVASQKESVENVIQGLTEFETKTYEKVEIKVNEIKSDAMLENEKMIRASVEEIRKTVMKAKHEGKDAELCYETAKAELDTLSLNGNAALDTCLKNSLNIVAVPLQSVANTVETGRQMITDLDSIIPDCYSSIFIRMQNCVMRKTFLMRSPVKQLQRNARAVKRTATLSTFNAMSKGRSCATKSVSDVRTGTTEIRVKSGSCIRNA